MNDMERFVEKMIVVDGCWWWTGASDRNGFGAFRYKGKTTSAHTAAWRLFKGEVPDGRRISPGECGWRSCVNPSHAKTKSSDPIERFLKGHKVSASGCWNWRLARDKNGYGRVSLKTHGEALAHRLSYAIRVKPPGDMSVLHKCDNPSCVNPDHLYLGSAHDNARDMFARGREGTSKISRAELKEIRNRILSGDSMECIALDFGVTGAAIRDIRSGKTWSHIK